MPETLTHTRPDIHRDPHEQLRVALEADRTYATIEALRSKQSDTLSELRAKASTDISDTTYVDTFLDGIDDQLDKHLEEQGVKPDDPKYEEIKELARESSIDNISDTDWYTGKTDVYGTTIEPSGSERIRAKVGTLHGASRSARMPKPGTKVPPVPDPTNPDTAPGAPRPENPALVEARKNKPELKAAIDELDELRAKLAALAAKQLGKPISISGKYNNARAEYNHALEYVGKFEQRVLDEVNSARTDVEKNVDFVKYIMAEQTKLRDATRELFENTKVNKFIGWFNRGGKMKRIGKGVLIGAPLGLVGILLPGAGIAAAGLAAGTFATRFTRNYMRHDNERGIRTADEAMNEADFIKHLETQGGTIENAVAYGDEKFNDDKKTQQRKRLGAAAWGFGGAVAGSAAVEAIAFASEHGLFSWTKDRVTDLSPFGDKGTGDTPNKGPSTNGSSQTGLSAHEQHVNHENHVNHVNHENHINHENHAEGIEDNGQSLDWSDFSDSAHTVTAGEGWYQTLKELGVPKKDWADVLNDAGPKLHQEGLAYFDSAHNEWRISDKGQLSEKGLKILLASSKKSGVTLAA